MRCQENLFFVSRIHENFNNDFRNCWINCGLRFLYCDNGIRSRLIDRQKQTKHA